MNSIRARLKSDDGFSMIELVVYASLLLIVLAIGGAMMLLNITVNRDVSSSASTVTAAQNVTDSVQRGVRQADWMSTPTMGTTQFVTVRTATSGATLGWHCEAWYFDSIRGAIYSRTSTSTITAPTDLAGWTMLADGIRSSDGSAVFSGSLTGFTLNFEATRRERQPTLVHTIVVSRQASSGNSVCE